MFEAEVNGDAKTVYFLMVIAFIILIIAWVNYINLSTVKAIFRSREVAIRKISGAFRIQLIKQFIIESFVINTIASILALLIVIVSMPYFGIFTGRAMGTEFSRDLADFYSYAPGGTNCIWLLSGTCNIIFQTHVDLSW